MDFANFTKLMKKDLTSRKVQAPRQKRIQTHEKENKKEYFCPRLTLSQTKSGKIVKMQYNFNLITCDHNIYLRIYF